MKNRNIDMTQGSIIKNLIVFAIPLFLSSIIQQMYNTVDLLFVGNVIGTNGAAAVGAGSMIINCLIGLFSGMSVGTNVVLARYFGQNDRKNLKKGVHTSVLIAIIGGIVLSLVGTIFAPNFLSFMKTPYNIMNDAVWYIRIYFISITSMILYNVCSGIIRAFGNSSFPMQAQFIGGIINIISDTLLVYVFRLGIKGAAFATFFSQTASAFLVIFFICTFGSLICGHKRCREIYSTYDYCFK